MNFETCKLTHDLITPRFAKFGLIKYARITKDKITGASRGSGFVCFKTKEDYATCLEAFGTAVSESSNIQSSTSTTIMVADPSSSASSSPFILAGRFLNVAPALVKSEAAKITLEKSEQRIKSDKRNLYLMKEGVIYPDSPAGLLIPASEMSKRQASFALRRKLLNENPNLFISKNRLSVRNLGKSIDDAFLKYLARYATIGFWKQVDASERAPLEQVVLQGEEGEGPVVPPSDERRVIIKQAKIVRDQEKINPKTNEGKSKGYGFIEFTNHADALACLRWLNNNGMAIPIARKKREKLEGEVKADKMTPIVEFAMENVLVLRKRTQRKDGEGEREERGAAEEGKSNKAGKKRKREAREAAAEKESASKGKDGKKKKYFH
jgi:nucleolar protein 4